MRRIVTLILPLAAVGLIAAGCGGDDNSTTSTPAASSTPAATTPSASTSTPSSSSDTVTIKMENTAFSPNDTTVKVGTKVEWENEDGFDHNVVATAGEDFKSKNFGQGGKFDYTVDKAGEITYVCTLHPGMEGKLTVTE